MKRSFLLMLGLVAFFVGCSRVVTKTENMEKPAKVSVEDWQKIVRTEAEVNRANSESKFVDSQTNVNNAVASGTIGTEALDGIANQRARDSRYEGRSNTEKRVEITQVDQTRQDMGLVLAEIKHHELNPGKICKYCGKKIL